jgi:hypothetical protein
MTHFEQPSQSRPLELRPDVSETHSSMAAFLASTLAAIVISIILIGAIAFLPAGLN